MNNVWVQFRQKAAQQRVAALPHAEQPLDRLDQPVDVVLLERVLQQALDLLGRVVRVQDRHVLVTIARAGGEQQPEPVELRLEPVDLGAVLDAQPLDLLERDGVGAAGPAADHAGRAEQVPADAAGEHEHEKHEGLVHTPFPGTRDAQSVPAGGRGPVSAS